jgi:hypothetical protein
MRRCLSAQTLRASNVPDNSVLDCCHLALRDQSVFNNMVREPFRRDQSAILRPSKRPTYAPDFDKIFRPCSFALQRSLIAVTSFADLKRSVQFCCLII